jgi:uncharacterized membrane protein (DUF373 family)
MRFKPSLHLVVARKLILIDFKTATLEQLAAYGGIALVLGIVFWLFGPAGNPLA